MKKRDATLLGVKFYCTGKPCKYGHLSDRYTKTGMCVDCVKIRSLIWKKDNPDAYKASMRKWWKNNKETHNARVKDWQINNKDRIKKTAKNWVVNNPEKVAAKSKRWRLKNPDKVLESAVKSNLTRHRRVPSWLTKQDKLDIQKTYALAKELTAAYGFPWEFDHIAPLRGRLVSGLHVPSNLQIIPKDQNRRKRNHYAV
jgi:hypothetical protein